MGLYRCRKCRQQLSVNEAVILHTEDCKGSVFGVSSIWYLDVDGCPEWILTAVQQAFWTKGKLCCVKCGGRLGSFNFVDIKTCPCGLHSLPPIHMLKDRLDHIVQNRVCTESSYGLHSPVSLPVTNAVLEENCSPSSAVLNNMGCSSRVYSEEDADILCVRPELGLSGTIKRLNDTDHLKTAVQFKTDVKRNLHLHTNGEFIQSESRYINNSFAGIVPAIESGLVATPRSAPLHDCFPHLTDFQDNLSEEIEPPTSSDQQPSTVLEVSRNISAEEADSSEISSRHIVQLASDSGNGCQIVDGANIEACNPFSMLQVEEAEGSLEVIPKHEVNIPSDLTCSVCLDLFYRPHQCVPCEHVFCEPCLRQIAKQKPRYTPCPLCRIIIRKCRHQTRLSEEISETYKRHYVERRHEQRRITKKYYPLPQCAGYTGTQHVEGWQMNRPFRYTNHRRDFNHSTLNSSIKQIVQRVILLGMLLVLHFLCFYLNSFIGWIWYTSDPWHFYQSLQFTFRKLVLFGVFYCCMKCLHVESRNYLRGIVSFVFIFLLCWDTDSWSNFMLNFVTLGSLFL